MLTVTQMVDRIKGRTFQKDSTKIIGELASAVDWAFNRIFDTQNGADLLSVFDSEKTLATYTREYDLSANVSTSLVGIKQLWIKFPTETTFTPARTVDTTDLEFIFNDQWASSDVTTVAKGHPVLFDVINFAKLRFAPPLAAGTVLRIDYWKKPNVLDPTTNNNPNIGTDLPFVVEESVIDKATAQIFDLMDDSRADRWDRKAEARLTDALYVIARRTAAPPTIKPFRIHRKRYI